MYQNLPSLSWTEGLFLRPHHFQQAQLHHAVARQSDRTLALPYTYGLINLELDKTALENGCFRLKKLQAILPGGVEVDMPGNSRANDLDLTAEIGQSSLITIYAALPPLREGERNEDENETEGVRRFEPYPQECYDENAGGNEQLVMFRRMRVLLSSKSEELPGYEKMPILRLECRRTRDGKPVLTPDAQYVPPALCLSAVPMLYSRLEALCTHLDRVAQSIVAALRQRELQEQPALRLEKMTKCAFVRAAVVGLRGMMACAHVTPVALYGELGRLLMQLAAFSPQEDCVAPPSYCHDDCLPQFEVVIDGIYRLTRTEATEWCVRVDLTYQETDAAWHGSMQPEWINSVRAAYVSVRSEESPRRVADLVEAGDVFKLTAGSQATKRVRGVHLMEERLPSPLLPPGGDRLWFCTDKLASDATWQDICEEKQCALTWSEKALPHTEAELYLILSRLNNDR